MRTEPYPTPIHLPHHVYRGLRAAELAGVPLTDPDAVERYALAQEDWWTLRFLFGERRVLYTYAVTHGFALTPLADLAGVALDGGN